MTELAAIPPAPRMSRRPPLTNLPNAVNSPFNVSTVTTKRARSHSASQRENYGQPPQKKQATEQPGARTPIRHAAPVERRVAPPKKAAVRTRPVALAQPRTATTQKDIEERGGQSIKAWQRFYRNAFPDFVFFFESIPEDIVARAQRALVALGASQDKYFSSKVTHVISNREPPLEQPAAALSKPNGRTVNPLLLQRGGEPSNKAQQRRLLTTAKASNDGWKDADSRRGGRVGTDILLKAREYGMKIWAVDKLERVINGLHDLPLQAPTLVGDPRGGSKASGQSFTGTKNNDLSHLLRNERLHGPTDRDPCAVPKDLVYFKGPMIYVRDASQVHRPIMVREYPKVQRGIDGTWPQFRSVSGGKCPFIEEKRDKLRDREYEMERAERAREKAKEERERANTARAKEQSGEQVKEKVVAEATGRTRAATAGPRPVRTLKAVAEVDDGGDSKPPIPSRAVPKEQAFQVPTTIPAKRTNSHRPNELAFTATNENSAHRLGHYNQEPAASGVQPSNITSAIRSQMVSSHLDQPGQRAGTSKEIYGLQRKVAGNVLLANPPAKASITRSQRMTDLAGVLREARKALTKRDVEGQEKTIAVRPREKDGSQERGQESIQEAVKREPRPGYCENCREKFDDMEEHSQSRKHMKFATDPKNWAELDDLLSLLWRPRKGELRRQ